MPGDGVEPAPGDDRLQETELEQTLRGGVGDGRFDRAQRRHQRGDVARRVERGDRLAQRLRGRIGAETLDELPVLHAPALEAPRSLLVVVIDGLDEEGAALARADAATERLLRRDRRVALPEERLHDDRTVTRRAVRAVKLAHR